MRTTRLPAAALATLLTTACGDPSAGARPLVATVDTVDGVETLAYAVGAGALLPWSLDTLAVLGDAFAEDEYQFNGVGPERLAGDGAGALYVLDSQGKRVLKYGPEGEHRATLGGPGEGPGELSQPIGLDVGPGDTVWVSDFSNSRLTGYPPDGGEPRTLAFPEDAGLPSARLAALEEGFLVVFRPLFAFGRGSGGPMRMSRPGGQDGADAQRLPLLRLDPSFRPADTLWTTPEPPMDMVQIEAGDRIMVAMVSREFWPELQWGAFSDGGVALSDGAAYAIRILDPDGRVARMIRREPAPRLTTEADREAVRQRLRDEAQEGTSFRVGGGGPSEEMQQRILEQRLEKMTFADTVPRVVRLAVDPLDRVWVGVSEDTPNEVDRIDVYNREGRLLGELRDFPFPDVFLDPTRIGILRRDDLDVQQVVVARLAEREAMAAGE